MILSGYYFYCAYSTHCDEASNQRNTDKCPIFKLYVQSFTWLLHVSTPFSRHLQVADTVPARMASIHTIGAGTESICIKEEQMSVCKE